MRVKSPGWFTILYPYKDWPHLLCTGSAVIEKPICIKIPTRSSFTFGVFNCVPATCWAFMGPAFFMNVSSLSNVRMGSVAMFSDLSRAPLALLPWFVRWMISPKWALSPLVDRPFSSLTGWTPLTTWTEGLLKKGVEHTEDCGYSYDNSIVTRTTNESLHHPLSLRSLKIYTKKRVQIQTVNISEARSFSWSHSCLLGAWILWLIAFSIEVYYSKLLFLAQTFYTVHGGLASVWAQGNFEMRKRNSSFTFLWHWPVHFLSCYLAGSPLALADNQQTLEETK